MAYEFKNRIDMTDLLGDIKRLYGKGWPKMLAAYIGDMAEDADDAATLRTRGEFDLHSEYIPRGIRSTPGTPAQLRKVENSLKRHYDGFGAVYLRGSADPKRSLGFMAHHEIGFKRDPESIWRSAQNKKYIANPGAGLRDKSFRTQTGKVRKRWKPATLLDRFEQSGSRYEHGTTKTNKYPGRRNPGAGTVPGKVFLIRGRNSGAPVVVRRVSRGGGEEGKGKLETLYHLSDSAEIKGGVWRFEDTVIHTAKRSQRRIARFQSNRLAQRF